MAWTIVLGGNGSFKFSWVNGIGVILNALAEAIDNFRFLVFLALHRPSVRFNNALNTLDV